MKILFRRRYLYPHIKEVKPHKNLKQLTINIKNKNKKYIVMILL